MKKSIMLGSCLCLALLARNVQGGLDTWDPQGASGNAVGGTWENASWDTANQTGTASPVNFVEGDAANFAFGALGGSASTFTVTMNGNHTVAGIFNGPLTPKSCFLTISGSGIMSLPASTTQGIDTAGSTLGQTTINVVVAGTSAIFEAEGGGGLILNGANTFNGGFEIDGSGGISFGNNAAFGTGTITWLVGGFIQPAVAGTAYNISNAMTHLANGIETFSGNTGGVTFSGPWTLGGANTTVTLENISSTITVSGAIGGAGALVINKAGTAWSLTGVNTYSGNTAITAGTLAIGGSGKLGSGSYAGNITNAGAFNYGSSASQTLSGVISGAGKITNNGSGTLALSGVNTFTGGLTQNGGTLNLNTNAALGTSAGTFTITGGTIDNTSGASVTTANLPEAWNGDFAFTGTQPLNLGTGAVTPNANRQITVNGSTLTVGGIIGGGAVALTKAGSGTLSLNGVNTYSGGTTISAGTLTVGGAGKLAAAGNITNNGTFNYSSSATLNISGVISGSGVLNENGSAALTLSGPNTYTNITTINSGGTLNVSSDGNLGTPPSSFAANQLTLNGGTLGLTATAADLNVNRGISLAASSTISATSGQSPSIEGTISGSGVLTKSAAGNLSLNGSNTFSGGMIITGGGVRFNTNYAAGTGTITVTPASIITLRTITPPAPTNVTITNAIVLNANGGSDIDLTAATGNTFTLSGNISGVGYFTRGRASGSGGVIGLSGSNTFSGGLVFEGGILSLGSSNALGIGNLTVQPGANNAVVLESSTALTGVNAITNPVNFSVAGASGFGLGGANDLELAGPVGLSNSFASAVTITNNNTGASIISGVISSTVSGIGLTVAGTGTLTLNNADTYDGNTTINGGTLALGAAGSINSSPVISIAGGAIFDVSSQASYSLGTSTLSASGTTSNAATINGGTTVDFGSQAVSLSFTPTTFVGDASHPALVVSQGALNLSGNTISVNNAAATPLGAGSYALIQVTGGTITGAPSASVSVTGSGVAAGATASISVSGGVISLVVIETPVFSLTSPSITYGTASVTLGGKLESVGGAYPANGETITVTMNGISQTTMINDSTGDFSLSSNSAAIPYSAVPYPITYSYGGDTYLNPANDSSSALTVNQAPLTVTATPQAKTYGQTVVFGSGSLLFTSSPLSNSETIGSVTLVCSGGVSNAPVSGSPYPITPSAATGGSGTEANYSITYVADGLTINPLTVVLAGAQVYNGTNIVTNSSLSVANALGGDDVSVASGSGTMAGATIGTNAITSTGTLALGGTTGTSYTLAGAGGSVIVTPLAVVLTGTRPYDGTATAAAAILSVSNAVAGDDVSAASGSATLADSAAGPEAITDASGLVLGGTTATNYTVTAASGSVAITTVALSITANPVTKTYGTAISLDPTAFVVGDGPLVGSEMVTAATMMASGGTAATDPVSGSPYTITPSAATGTGGFLAANYDITYNTNSLTVNPLAVVLTGTRLYDGTATAASTILSVSNVVGSDDVNAASGSVNLASSSVGTNVIISVGTLALGGVTAPNYTLTAASGTVTITDPDLPFAITSVLIDNTGTNLVLVWQSIPGDHYQMLSSTNITDWTNDGPLILATGPTTTNTVPVDARGRSKSYIFKNSK